MSAIQQVVMDSNGFVPGSDPNFSSVVMLLHMDGTNGSTTFTDSSTSAKTMTASGGVTVDTGSPKFGTGCALYAAASEVITAASSTDFDYGTGDLTIEFWINPTTISITFADIIGRYSAANPNSIAIQQRLARLHLLVSVNGTTWAIDLDGSSDVLTAGTWAFVQLVRVSGVFNMYVNGSLHLTSSATALAVFSTANTLRIGNNPSSANQFAGRLDDLRITKGVARANAVPTAAFPNF